MRPLLWPQVAWRVTGWPARAWRGGPPGGGKAARRPSKGSHKIFQESPVIPNGYLWL